MTMPLDRSTLSAPSRRQFMVGAAGFSFAIALGEIGADTAAAAVGSDVSGRKMSPWVTISTDDVVAIMSPAAEMGQGSLTSLPLILAEELDADWSKVRVVVAPPNDELYKNPAFGFMYTAGSNAVTAYFKDLRRFGAQDHRTERGRSREDRAPPVLWRDRHVRRNSGQSAGGRGKRAQEAGSVPAHPRT